MVIDDVAKYFEMTKILQVRSNVTVHCISIYRRANWLKQWRAKRTSDRNEFLTFCIGKAISKRILNNISYMTRENCTVYKHRHVEIVIVLVEIL